MGQRILVFPVSADSELDPAFAGMAQQGANALLVADNRFFSTRRAQIIAQANSRALPAIYYTREFATDGGLVSYGSSAIANYGRAGAYVARILKGTPPAELPVEQPTKFELVINLKTAKALALVALAARHALPAAYGNRDEALTGGLTSYSASISGAYQLSSMKPVSRCGTRGGGGGACACGGLTGTICRRDTLLIVPSPDRLITL
jgi:ABC transporter substrate binding protein